MAQATETVSLAPNYGAVFARFSDAAASEAKFFLKDAKTKVRLGIHPPIPKVHSDALQHVQGFVSCMNTALQSATSQEDIDKLRDQLHEFAGELRKVSDERQAKEDERYDDNA